jgi:hypothetical protein
MAPALEAVAYVAIAKKKASAEAHFGSSGSGAVQSSSAEQPHLEKAANGVTTAPLLISLSGTARSPDFPSTELSFSGTEFISSRSGMLRQRSICGSRP